MVCPAWMGQSVEVFGLVVEAPEQESGLGSGDGAGEDGREGLAGGGEGQTDPWRA